MRGERHAPAALYPRERPGTHCTGGWVGPRAGVDRRGKISPPPEFDPRTIQPVATRYTDYATRPTLSTGLALQLTPLSEDLSFLRELNSSEHLNLHQHLCERLRFRNLLSVAGSKYSRI